MEIIHVMLLVFLPLVFVLPALQVKFGSGKLAGVLAIFVTLLIIAVLGFMYLQVSDVV